MRSGSPEEKRLLRAAGLVGNDYIGMEPGAKSIAVALGDFIGVIFKNVWGPRWADVRDGDYAAKWQAVFICRWDRVASSA